MQLSHCIIIVAESASELLFEQTHRVESVDRLLRSVLGVRISCVSVYEWEGALGDVSELALEGSTD